MPVVLLVCFPYHAERILLGFRVFNDTDLLHLAMDELCKGHATHALNRSFAAFGVQL